MALAIDGTGPAFASSNSVVSITTASFTPPAGSMLVVRGTGNGMSGATQTLSVSSSPSLTFTLADQHHAADTGACAIWTAPVSVSQSYTVTVTRSEQTAGSFLGCACFVQVITGAEAVWAGAHNGASGGPGLPSTNITTTGTTAFVFAVSMDWQENGAGTVGTSQTMEQEQNLSTEYNAHFWRYNGTPAPGTYTLNLTAPSGQIYNQSVVEIREATGMSATRVGQVRGASSWGAARISHR